MMFINQKINFSQNCKSLLIDKNTFIDLLKKNENLSFKQIQFQSYNLTFLRRFVKSAKIYKTSSLSKKKPINKINYSLGQRKSLILPKHIGRVFFIHNGKSFLSVHISPKMLGHKFGEFASTRKKPYHKKK